MEAQTDIFKANVLLHQLEEENERLRQTAEDIAKEHVAAVHEAERLREELIGNASSPTYLADTAKFWHDRLRRIEEAVKALLLTRPGSRERWRKEMALRAALANQPSHFGMMGVNLADQPTEEKA